MKNIKEWILISFKLPGVKRSGRGKSTHACMVIKKTNSVRGKTYVEVHLAVISYLNPGISHRGIYMARGKKDSEKD